MRILLITDYLPYPPIAGDLIRVYNLIRRMAAQHSITLVVLLPSPDSTGALAHLGEFCDQIIMADHPWPKPITILPDLVRYLVHGKPIELRLLYSQKVVDTITRLTAEQDFDAVQIEHSRLAFYIDSIQSQHSKTFLTFHNVASDQYQKISGIEKNLILKLRWGLHSLLMRRWEPAIAQKFSCCFTVSEDDKRLLLENNPDLRIQVIPNGVDTKKYQKLDVNPGSKSILFIGSMSYAPCIDAAIFFCKQILPVIRKRLPQVQVWIIGASPAPEVKALADENIHVTGFVEDILPYYEQAAVSIVPLRAGGGTRLKILEAMALGRPIISTQIGCEGLDVTDGEHLLVADAVQEFADKTVRLMTDNSLYSLIASNARQLVEEKYDWDEITRQQLEIYQVATNPPAGGRDARPVKSI